MKKKVNFFDSLVFKLIIAIIIGIFLGQNINENLVGVVDAIKKNIRRFYWLYGSSNNTWFYYTFYC